MKCVVCGKEIKESMFSDDVICSHDCFTKHFWEKTLDKKAIIINGECYHIGEESGKYCGVGGAKYTIKKHNGKIIETTHLWQNGTIPKEFYKGDNAEFVWNCK